jgi:hypothetical protein
LDKASASSGDQGSPLLSLLVGAGLTVVIFVVLATSGFFNKSGAHQGGQLPSSSKRGLRGSDGGRGFILTSTGEKIAQSREDHHKSRVLMIPSLEPFHRRNVHHYSRHDPNGKLLPPGAARTAHKTAVRAEEANAPGAKKPVRRTALASAEDVLRNDTKKLGLEAHSFGRPYRTSGVALGFHSITGVDKYHHFDVNDYFGSSVTLMQTNKKSGYVTLAVGAPGALENSGMIYFLTLDKQGEVESYSYLTNADDSLGSYWSSNVALGWAVENIGDLDGE